MGAEHENADVAAVGLLDERARRLLYEWVLSQARPVGREEASRALGLTRALATFHLEKLVDAGLLDAGYQRLTGRVGPGAGRPARVYRRGSREFSVTVPERRYQRAAELFASALDGAGEEALERLLAAARVQGERLAAETRARPAAERGESGDEATRRGDDATRPSDAATGDRAEATDPLLTLLRGEGYEPEVDAFGTIRLRNCPFHALVDPYRPLICGANLAFAQGLTRGVGRTDVMPVLEPRPGRCCVAFVPTPGSGPDAGRPKTT